MTFQELQPYLTITLSIIASILGFLSFYNQYLRKFKPKIFINSEVVFNLTQREKVPGKYLLNIFLSISISNSKNSFGILEDFLIRLYSTDDVSPKADNFYPNIISEFNEDKNIQFTPIIMPPKSFTSKTIIFIGEMSTLPGVYIDISKSFALELFCKFDNNKNWVLIDKIHLYNKQIHNEDKSENKIIYSSINIDVQRDKGRKQLVSPSVDIFKGVTGEWFFYKILRIKYLLKLPLKYFRDLIMTILLSMKSLLMNIVGFLVMFPIIKKRSNRKFRVSGGIVNADDYTRKTIKYIYTHIPKYIDKINVQLPDERKIFSKIENEIFYIYRDKYEIQITTQGSDAIIISGQKGWRDKFYLEYKYKRNSVKYKYWTFKNKTISKRRILLSILDYFCLFSVE